MILLEGNRGAGTLEKKGLEVFEERERGDGKRDF